MTNELERAASAASEATGLDVQVSHSGRLSAPSILIELWDGGASGFACPVEQRDVLPVEALAYLEGLECGARIQKERYAALVGAARSLADEHNNGHFAPADGNHATALAEALSQLED